MLFYYLLTIFILTSGIFIGLLYTPAYRIFDTKLDYPYKMGFDHQNCQLDKSCWVKNNSGLMVPLKSPNKNWNSVFVEDTWKQPAGFPASILSNRYGCGKSPNFPIG